MLIELDITDPAVATAVLALQREVYLQATHIADTLQTAALEESLPQLMACGESFLGWRVGDELLGLVAFESSGKGLHLTRLMVAPTASRKGIATRLLTALIQRPGRRAISVETTADNAPAIVLYTGLGFTHRRESRQADGSRTVYLQRGGA